MFINRLLLVDRTEWCLLTDCCILTVQSAAFFLSNGCILTVDSAVY